MNDQFKKLSFLLFLMAFAILNTACSNGGDSGGDAGGGGGGGVPANAIVITDANAEATVASAASSNSTMAGALAVETTPTMSLTAALEIVMPLIKNRLKNSGIDLVNGVDVNDTGACPNGGTFSDIGHSAGDGTSFSENGTSSFVNCSFGFGFIFDGSITYSSTDNSSTGDYTDSVSGSLSLIDSSSNTKLSFTGMNFKESGNRFTGASTISVMSFTIDFIVNGSGSGGFTVSLLTPIVENDGDPTCPESGSILITGGNNTTAEGVYNGNLTMTIKANGAVVVSDAQCYS